MKLIIAFIQPHKLPDVKRALFGASINKMTVTNALGSGSQGGYTETYRGAKEEINLLKKIRIEIAVSDSYLEKTIAALVKGAKTGHIGDGKIFIQEIQECIRIRTGEKGEEAIG